MAEQQEDPKPAVVLRYVGSGFLIGVPARDLTADDLAQIAEADDQVAAEAPKDVAALPRRDRKALLKSGLYEPVEAPAKEK